MYKTNRRGGGIKFYYSDYLISDVCEEVFGCFVTHESLVVKALLPGFGKLMICGFYRIPNTSIDLFLQSLSDILLCTNDCRSIIGGDFNLNILQAPVNRACFDYTQLMTSYGFNNFINNFTYISPVDFTEVSCIDHIWCNFFTEDANGYVIKPNLSDHYPVCIIFNLALPNPSFSIKFRNLVPSNIENFKNHINDEFSRCNPPLTDVNAYSNYLTAFLIKLSNKYFPIMTKQMSQKRLNNPWMSDVILRCIKKKYVWFRLLKRNRILKSSYNIYCKALRNLLRIAEEDYYKNKLNSLGNDQKKNWKTLNSLLGKKTEAISDCFVVNTESIYDENEIATCFSNHFVELPESIYQNIPHASTDFSHLIPQNPHTMFFRYSTEQEILSFVSSMKNGGSIDDIPCLVLKLCIRELAKYLSKLFNMCLEHGAYP